MRRLQKSIDEIGWTKGVPQFGAGDLVAKAYDVMSRDAHDCVLIVEGGLLAGIFTSRDFLNRVAAPRRDPQTLTLGEVMTPAPRALRPRDPVAFAINWMAVESFRNVPIIDDDQRVLGVLSVWDVMRALNDVFDDIDATPRPSSPKSEISEVISLIDLGGGG